ncbi:helix-turn-helix domain-containing protein [Rhizorhabdus dicambivorans]|uniref:XRE family transcriptional regulator n=1 Tax=Rhizorhabdus dicambivorans TaxID=1850238 RepID=A0A2A4FX24_9SPHN|nr:short-chain fatty acyl-CoA regulator family protein [Rhizorhabdus dicambivorans]ATE63169.1 XRE family transcriptional regulator [Rhizorhabdus dicambivorans]PCE43346.1 XRE family transcriptional regulator [Rhizorhabdus dicambivorans]
MARRTGTRLFAGHELKALRQRAGLGQAAMAARVGLSVSYLSQLENDDRPITPAVSEAFARTFPIDWNGDAAGDNERRLAGLREALADPLFAASEITPQTLHRMVEQQPLFADQFVRLHDAWRRTEERLQLVDDRIASGVPGDDRLPWEEVRDWFHDEGNYVDSIDRAAEALAGELDAEPLPEALLAHALKHRHGVDAVIAASDGTGEDGGLLRRFDRARGLLTIGAAQPPETRRFMMAHQLAQLEFADAIGAVAGAAQLRAAEARPLLSVGLANYAAGALLMPYRRFRDTARALRHDIDRLCQRFGVSFEQACHRLSTLQRPAERGIPFFFCRVDMAGNITKRHSATRLQFARFGGACPLWIVHEAVAIPDRILVQLAEMPDGVRYVSMAKGLVKPSGSFTRAPRRYAVALGCEADHARDFIYADALDTRNVEAATPIGVSCRLCPRRHCDQRAFPPAGRAIAVDADRRDVVPYRLA